MPDENWALSRDAMGSFKLLQAPLPGNHHRKRIAVAFFYLLNFLKKLDDYSQNICMFSGETVIISLTLQTHKKKN